MKPTLARTLKFYWAQFQRFIRGQPLIHCWAVGPHDQQDIGSTCMRAWGHWGKHEFVSDSEIGVSFAEQPE
jgi:hypothetical protein